MSFSKMDPSCTFGFYLKSEADLVELTRISESLGTHKIFELLDGTKEDYLLLVHDPSIKVLQFVSERKIKLFSWFAFPLIFPLFPLPMSFLFIKK